MSNRRFTTTATAEEVRPGIHMVPIEISIDDQAATREVVIQTVRKLGHEFVERSDWHAKLPIEPLEVDWDYSMIALHHAGRSYSCGEGAEQMLDTQKHQQNGKFYDIGYHFGIDCAGKIYEGRDIRFKASGVERYNTGVISVVLLNNLTSIEEGGGVVAFGRKILDSLGVSTVNQIPALQVDATVDLIEALQSVFFIKRLGGHKEYPGQSKGEGKICPGHIGMELVRNLRIKTRLLPPPTS